MQKKNANIIRFFLLLALLPLIVACSAERTVQFEHLKGTLAWKQQNWNEAVLHFCEAEELAAELPDVGIKNYTDFALASSYLMQGEDTAAQEKLRKIPDTADDPLRTQQFYQQGIIAFRAKAYTEAAALFKKSLELNSGDIEAKINYELSRKFCKRQIEAQYGTPQNAAEERIPEPVEDSIILDIIRKREQAEWKKMQHEAEPLVNDY